MKYLSWIITLPLLVIAVIFAIGHRQRVAVDLWPLPLEVAPPLYLLVLVAVFIGFVIGGLMTWLSQGRHRRRAREQRYRAERAERDLDKAQKKVDSLRAAVPAAESAHRHNGAGRLAHHNQQDALLPPHKRS